jgi:hypothetical protein
MIMKNRLNKSFLFVVVTAAVLMICGAGCHEAGVLHYFLMPDQKVEAEFELSDKPLVILVDDVRGLVDPPMARQALVESLSEELREHKVARRITTNEELARVRQAEPDFDKLSIREVGRKVNADVMIWISVIEFGFDQNLEMAVAPGRFVAKVKVFDIRAENEGNLRLWPTQRQGRFVDVEIPPHKVRSCKNKAEVHEKLADAMADKIARLFYEYTKER